MKQKNYFLVCNLFVFSSFFIKWTNFSFLEVCYKVSLSYTVIKSLSAKVFIIFFSFHEFQLFLLSNLVCALKVFWVWVWGYMSWLLHISTCSNPVDTGRKFNVHKTFRRRSGRFLNVLRTFNLRPVSTRNWIFANEKKLKSKMVAINFQICRIFKHLVRNILWTIELTMIQDLFMFSLCVYIN